MKQITLMSSFLAAATISSSLLRLSCDKQRMHVHHGPIVGKRIGERNGLAIMAKGFGRRVQRFQVSRL